MSKGILRISAYTECSNHWVNFFEHMLVKINCLKISGSGALYMSYIRKSTDQIKELILLKITFCKIQYHLSLNLRHRDEKNINILVPKLEIPQAHTIDSWGQDNYLFTEAVHAIGCLAALFASTNQLPRSAPLSPHPTSCLTIKNVLTLSKLYWGKTYPVENHWP